VWARGRGKPALCGPNGGMWTLVGEMMNEVIMSGNRIIYADKGAGP